jgi:putative ABC transport system ATP-binding protein
MNQHPGSRPETTLPAADPVVVLDNIRLTLDGASGKVNILRGLNLQVRSGEVVGVVGPSGSGKSTMMMIMGGLERATSGEVRVAGRTLGAMSEDALALFRREHVGIVFQNFHLIPTMTALENVAIPLEFAGRSDAFTVARAGLEAVGLGHRLTHYPSQLSGGEQQRVALARAVAPRPNLILADEPTGNLDGATGAQIIDLLFKLAREHGSTLVMITHDPALASQCDRVIRVRDGLIENDGTGTDTLAAAQ